MMTFEMSYTTQYMDRESGMAREPDRYQLQVIASARRALSKSKIDLFGAHSLKWRLAASTVSRFFHAQV